MIEVITDIDLLSQKLKIVKDDFPPFYLGEYYIGQNVNVVFIVEEQTVVPVSFSRHYFLKNVQFLFTPLCRNVRLNEIDERDFLNRVVQYISENKFADRVLPSQNYSVYRSFPKDAVFCPFGTYFLDLSLSIDDLWANMHTKHRNVIRNAEKKGSELKVGLDQMDVFFMLYEETMKRSSLSYYSLDYFHSLKKNMNDSNLICVVAYYNNKPQGALLMPYSNYGAYYIYGASAENMELTGINNYMHWEVIKLLKAKNVQRYDFVGARLSDVSNTKLSGIQMFKERFGSNLEAGFLWKLDLTFKCKIYDFLVFCKVKLSGKDLYQDIIDQENAKII